MMRPSRAPATAAEIPRFQVGGTVQEGALYVPRPADAELPAALLRQEFCYVLAPRQIGKSSLRVRTRRHLEPKGVRCASLDLSQMGGGDCTAQAWYFDMVHQIAKQLGLGDPRAFWEAHALLSPLARFATYLREQVLLLLRGQVVIFIDEIDALLALPATGRDDFFAGVRALYNARADEPCCRRLTFCFFGVAMPGDLIGDEARTPFNIGKGIALQDFTRAEMDAMRPGLWGCPYDPALLLDAVFSHTAGHPYMTQKLCEALVEQDPVPLPEDADCARAVARMVDQLFLRRGRVLETNLSNAEKYFIREARSSRTNQMLRLYGRLRSGERVAALGHDPIQMALRLTGMAAERQEGAELWLKVRNPIFAAVFDDRWVIQREAERVLAEPLCRWLRAGKDDAHLLRGEALRAAYAWFRNRDDVAAEETEFIMACLEAARREEQARSRRRAAIAVSLVVSMGWAAWHLTRRERSARVEAETAASQERRFSERAEQARRLALLDKGRAEQARDEAAAERRSAERAQALAEQALAVAEDKIGRAEREKVLAERALHEAEAARAQAEEKIRLAVDETQRAEVARERAGLVRQQAERALDQINAGHGLLAEPEGKSFVLPHVGMIFTAAFSPDGAQVVAAGAEGSARLWDVRTGRSQALAGHAGTVSSATFSPDGTRLATASWDGSVILWDTRSARAQALLAGHRGPVLGAVFSPDGEKVVSASSDLSARLWRVRDGRPGPVLWGHHGPVYAARFSPDGARVVTASADGRACIWDAAGGARLLCLSDGEEALRAASFSPDQRRVLTAGDDGTARLWDVSQRRLLFRLAGHHDGLNAAAFSSDGSRVVTASEDGTACIWEARRGRLLFRLSGHKGAVLAAAFSPDGGRVVTAGADGTARIWDAKSGRLLLRLLGHQNRLFMANFSPDGGRVVTASADGTARIYPGSVEAWLRAGCNLLVQPADPGTAAPRCQRFGRQ